MTKRRAYTLTFSSFIYSLKQGLKSIWRNRLFSIASIVTMTACIFLFGIFYCLLLNVNETVRYYEEDIGISVFFDEDLTPEEKQEIGRKIETRPEVATITFVSADEAWEQFKEIYFEGDTEAAESFVKGNPLTSSESYSITTNTVEEQPALVEYIESLDGVRKVNRSDEVVQTLSGFNRLITYVTIAIVAILLIVAIVLISNTVNVGISARRNEINIMKLIGATDSFVRAPFIVEGALIGLIGSIIPLIILYFIYDWLVNLLVTKFSVLQSLTPVLLTNNEIFFKYLLVAVGLLLGLGIGLVGSITTVRKHLRV